MAYATKITAGGTTKDIKDAEALRANSTAEDYSNTKTYAVGDYCVYGCELYRCKTAITVAEGWEPSHWEKKKLVDLPDDEFDSESKNPIQNKVVTDKFIEIDASVSSLNQAISELELSTILIDSQGRFYIKEDE